MSIKVMTFVWEHSHHKGSVLLTLLAIADFASDDGTNAYPAIATLAEKTRMTERNVQIVLKKLETSQELTMQRNAGPHGCHIFAIPLKHEVQNVQGEKFSGVKSFQGEKYGSAGVKGLSPDPLRDPSDLKKKDPPLSKEAPLFPKQRRKMPFPSDPDKAAQLKASVLTPTFFVWYERKGLVRILAEPDIHEQWDAFVRKAIPNDYRYIDWGLAFQNWLTSDFQKRLPHPSGPTFDDWVREYEERNHATQ